VRTISHKGQYREDQVNELKIKHSAQRRIFTRAAQYSTCYGKASHAEAKSLTNKI
jgi:hypothetical protein